MRKEVEGGGYPFGYSGKKAWGDQRLRVLGILGKIFG